MRAYLINQIEILNLTDYFYKKGNKQIKAF